MPSSTENFISKARKIHGDKYDYSKTVYVKAKSKVIIICSKHGEFDQTPNGHLNGSGCRMCVGKSLNGKNRIQYMKEKALSRRGTEFDYSNVDWATLTNKTTATIVCKKHGSFQMEWGKHIAHCYVHGCPSCSKENMKEIQYLPLSEFIEKSVKVHGDKYDYSQVDYVGAHKKVKIICKTHGHFYCTPANHWSNGVGCPGCLHSNPSKGEAKIAAWLERNHIQYEYQKSYSDLWWKSNKGRLKYDFWLSKENVLIEYDGEHHFLPLSWSKKIDGSKRLIEQQAKDQLKNEYAEKNNIKLVRILYNQDIEQILEAELPNR